MVTSPFVTTATIRGAQRTVLYFKKIIRIIPIEMDKSSKKLIYDAKRIAMEEITRETKGFGTLANALFVEHSRGTKFNRYRLLVRSDSEAYRYHTYVHDSFTPHWVKISTNPNLRSWLEKNLPAHVVQRLLFLDRVRIGGKNSAPWIKAGGVKYMDKAFARISGLSRTEYTNRINKILNTR